MELAWASAELFLGIEVMIYVPKLYSTFVPTALADAFIFTNNCSVLVII